jgi:hypothetical protein
MEGLMEENPVEKPTSEFPMIADGNFNKFARRSPKNGKQIQFMWPEIKKKVFDLACEGKALRDIAAIIGITATLLHQKCRKEIVKGAHVARLNGIDTEFKESERYELTESERMQLQTMAGIGLKNDQIAMLLNISLGLLQTRYQDDIYIGRALGTQKVATTLMDMATDGEHVSATQFYLKTQAGWREVTSVEFPDENGNPQHLSGTTVNINLTADKMQAMIQMLNEKV